MLVVNAVVMPFTVKTPIAVLPYIELADVTTVGQGVVVQVTGTLSSVQVATPFSSTWATQAWTPVASVESATRL